MPPRACCRFGARPRSPSRCTRTCRHEPVIPGIRACSPSRWATSRMDLVVEATETRDDGVQAVRRGAAAELKRGASADRATAAHRALGRRRLVTGRTDAAEIRPCIAFDALVADVRRRRTTWLLDPARRWRGGGRNPRTAAGPTVVIGPGRPGSSGGRAASCGGCAVGEPRPPACCASRPPPSPPSRWRRRPPG